MRGIVVNTTEDYYRRGLCDAIVHSIDHEFFNGVIPPPLEKEKSLKRIFEEQRKNGVWCYSAFVQGLSHALGQELQLIYASNGGVQVFQPKEKKTQNVAYIVFGSNHYQVRIWF